jgi:hypothetical protein
MATTVNYAASLVTRKTNYSSNGSSNSAAQEFYEAGSNNVGIICFSGMNLANKIIQIAVDDNAFGYVGLFNHTTVMKPGVSGFAEKIPFDFYGIDANTVKQ